MARFDFLLSPKNNRLIDAVNLWLSLDIQYNHGQGLFLLLSSVMLAGDVLFKALVRRDFYQYLSKNTDSLLMKRLGWFIRTMSVFDVLLVFLLAGLVQ